MDDRTRTLLGLTEMARPDLVLRYGRYFGREDATLKAAFENLEKAEFGN